MGTLKLVTEQPCGLSPDEHPADGAVLARGVHALEHEDHAAAGLGPEAVVQLVEAGGQHLAAHLAAELVAEAEGVARVALVEARLGARFHGQLVGEAVMVVAHGGDPSHA